MSLNTKNIKSTGGPRAELLEPNIYPGRIVQVIDLGIQKRKPYLGVAKPPCNQIWITYELCSEFLPNEDGTDDLTKPRWVSEKLNAFPMTVDNAKSTIRMNAIDPAGTLDGDWTRALDVPVLVQVVNNEYQGKMYENVGSVSQPMKGQTVEPLVNQSKFFDCDYPNKDVFDSLPQFLQDIITGGVEWKGFDAQAEPATAGPEVAEFDDEPPF